MHLSIIIPTTLIGLAELASVHVPYVAREGALAGALTMSVLNFNSLAIIAVACPWFRADSADSMDLGN